MSKTRYSGYVGRITGTKNLVGFHGTSVAKLRGAFQEAVVDYLETCALLDRLPQKPYSGIADAVPANGSRKKTAFAGRFFVSLRLRLGLSTSHRQYWRAVMLLIFAHPRKVIFEPHDQIAEKCFFADTPKRGYWQKYRFTKAPYPFAGEPLWIRLRCRRSYASAAVKFGWWHNRFMPSDTVLHPCRMMPRRGLNRPPHRQYWRIC